MQEVLTLAQDVSHPFSLAQAYLCTTMLHQLCREAHMAQKGAETLIVIANDRGFSYWVALGTSYRGWALAEQGQTEDGTQQIQQGMAAAWTIGMELLRPHFLALLAETNGKTGQVEEGLTALAEALGLVDKTGERFYEAELYRLKGELTLQSSVQSLESRVKEAERCFLQAIEIAQKQQAKSLELRATTSLARLWQQQSKTAEAREKLAAIYNWFTEGFDTKDLQEAKALLEELGV
ncbi:MAG: hypothetical protein AB7G75_26290 [Candidatus Binatia bacterium]